MGEGGFLKGREQKTGTAAILGCLLGLWLAVGCSRPPKAPPPAPAAAPSAVTTTQARTIDEARLLLQAGRTDDYEQALRKLAQSSDVTTRQRALALHGLWLHEQKRHAEALPVLAEAASAHPTVAPFLRLRIVEGEVAQGNLERAAEVATELAGGDTSAATVARLRLPGIHAAQRDAAATAAAWTAAMQIPIDELTESDFVAMAAALAKAQRGDLAASTRMRLLSEYTRGRYTEELYEQLRLEIDALSNDEKTALAGKLARANRYDQALDLLAKIPDGAGAARETRLRALFNSRHYDQVLTQTSGMELADPSLILLRARAAWRADKPAEMLAELAKLDKRFPGSKEAIEARVVRAKYYATDQIDYAQAVANLTKAIDAGALGTDGENLWNLGWTYTLWGRHDEALRVFDRYISTYGDGDWKTNSLFWSAKILDRLGKHAERDAKVTQLVAEYPHSYYSWRAKELWPGVLQSSPPHPPSAPSPPAKSAGGEGSREVNVLAAPHHRDPSPPRTGEKVPKADEGDFQAGNPFPDLEGELAKAEEPRLEVVNELLAIGLSRAAAREMQVVATRHTGNPGVQFMLADVYVRAGEPFKANGVLQRQFRSYVRHGGANIPRRFWEILFPLPYWETIRAEAARRGLDPFLVAAIIRQESGFEPTTVSSAGAVGLMQIMPAEASRIAAAGGLPPLTRAGLFDPLTNIAIGAAEYAQKLALMKGEHMLAIASYNAGERAVGTWIEKTPIDDIDLFVESIPYAETRLYVKTVTRNRFEYRRIYESSMAALSSEEPAQ